MKVDDIPPVTFMGVELHYSRLVGDREVVMLGHRVMCGAIALVDIRYQIAREDVLRVIKQTAQDVRRSLGLKV